MVPWWYWWRRWWWIASLWWFVNVSTYEGIKENNVKSDRNNRGVIVGCLFGFQLNEELVFTSANTCVVHASPAALRFLWPPEKLNSGTDT